MSPVSAPPPLRALVLGGTGMLGYRVHGELRTRGWDVRCTVRGSWSESPLPACGVPRGEVLEGFDALEPAAALETLRALQPGLVINCIGLIKQKHLDPANAIAVNSLFPHLVAKCVATWSGKLIHVSTDCVFSGDRGDYTESDEPDARDLYGRTKLLGEVTHSGALTLRTSVIGRELRSHRSLLDWFLGNARGTVSGYTRHLYSGVTVPYLARLLEGLGRQHPNLQGLYHVAGPKITKHDLLCGIREAFGLDVTIVPDGTTVCDRSLDDSAFRAATPFPRPEWPTLLAELAKDCA